MKKRILLSLTVFVTFLGADQGIDKIKQMDMFNKPNVKISTYTEHGSTYHIKGTVQQDGNNNPFEAFVTKDYKEIIFGKGFDAKTLLPLKLNIDIQKAIKSEAYNAGSGKDEYLVFTDPECPYCQKLEKIIPLMGQNAKFHVFLFPLSFHKNAKQMSYYIMSKETNDAKSVAMHDIANGKMDYQSIKFSDEDIKKYEASLGRQFEVAGLFGVNGTPAVFNMNGDSVQWPQLLQKYNIKEPIDMQGVDVLRKNNLEIKLDDSKKARLHIFTSIESGQDIQNLEEIINKYKNSNALSIYLKVDTKGEKKNLVSIYSHENNDARAKLVNELISSKKINQAQSVDKDKETKYLPVTFIMQKMNISGDLSKLIVINDDGKVINY